MVNLHLVETLISHSLCMHNKAALRVRGVILVFIMVYISITKACWACAWNREVVCSWWLSQQRRAQPTLVVNHNDPPIVEATLPELTEVNGQVYVVRGDLDNIVRRDLMPCQEWVVMWGQVRWRWKAYEDSVWILLEVIVADNQFDFEVLSNTTYDRSESTLHLPIQTVIKHVQKDNCLISHEDVLMSH